MCISAGIKTFIDCAWEIWGVRSAPSSIIQRWSISKAVLKVSFSSAVKKPRCETDPWFVVIVDHVSSSFLPWPSKISSKYLFLTLKDPDKVLCV